MSISTARITTAELAFRGVGKDYVSLRGEAVRALSPIDLDVASESFVAIVGRSGCGKSTLLRLAAGLESPSSGDIELGGEPVEGPPDAVRYVFQNYSESLLPWRTVGDNVRFGLRHAYARESGGSRREQQELVEHYLGEVGLAGVASRYPGELSGGMQQRVAIARAL
ncbi:MAG TPA: ATP-binding cassette domain-containing protein, partial [Microbacteriaceae bacterium]|nr:ATP-binding cassette domain-containing protein [Microbacteriaceae bacterium]